MNVQAAPNNSSMLPRVARSCGRLHRVGVVPGGSIGRSLGRLVCASAAPSQAAPGPVIDPADEPTNLSGKTKERHDQYKRWLESTRRGDPSSGEAPPALLPEGVDPMAFTPLSFGARFVAGIKLAFLAPFWNRFKADSVLTMDVGGALPEISTRFGGALSLPQATLNLRKAAVDPRVSAVLLNLEPLSCGWAKLSELRRHIVHFRQRWDWDTKSYRERKNGDQEPPLTSSHLSERPPSPTLFFSAASRSSPTST